MNDGFYPYYPKDGPNKGKKWRYATSKPAFVSSGSWIPWDKASPEMKQGVTRGDGESWSGNYQPVPTGRDPFNPAPGTNNPVSPLSQGKKYAPKPMVTGMPATNTQGFMPDVTGSGNPLKDLGKKALGYLGDNPDLILGLIGGAGDWLRGRKEDKYTEEAIELSRDEAAARRAMAEKLMAQAQGLRTSRPDLGPVFADPSNVFNRRIPPLGG